jgi:zinc protease
MCDLETISHEQLWRHYESYYGPNNAIAAAVGDFDAPRMLERIDELFGRLMTRPGPQPIHRPEPPQRGERRVNLAGPGSTSYLQVAYHAPAASDPDFFPMAVLSTILTGASGMNLFSGSPPNRTSRLYKALVETELAASVSGGLPPTLDPYLYRIAATARSGKTPGQVEEALETEIERVLKEPISAEELETAIKQTKAQFAYSSESVTNQGYWLGYSSIVADIGWFETFLSNLEAVTVDEVQRVASAYLEPRNRTVGHYLGQAGAAGPGLSGEEATE